MSWSAATAPRCWWTIRWRRRPVSCGWSGSEVARRPLRRCHNPGMPLSRREFLAASLALVTAGCSLDGSDDTEIVRPESVAGEQVLDHSLRLAVPRASVAPVSVRSFERRTDVVVRVEEVADDAA